MMLSDVSIKRPVFASVLGLLLIALGIVSYSRLALREYPDIDPPVVNIRTNYPGAAANVVESRITEVIEERIAGVEGIRYISSTSSDGQSNITIEFDVSRNIDNAANDVRDRVSGVLGNLPQEADPPDVQKADAGEETVLWLNLSSDTLTPIELTDYAERYLVDRFSSIDGVARVQLGGARTPAMRVWLDAQAMAARGLAVSDIERAVRTENVELPAGSLQSEDLIFTARIERPFRTPEEFAGLVVGKSADGELVRLGDIARVEFGPEEDRNTFRGNGLQMMGMGIVKQSTANVVDVAKESRRRAFEEIAPNLPPGMQLDVNFDESEFVNASIKEVYITLGIAVALVVGVIFVFLGSVRATIVPAVTVPISIIAAFSVLYAMGLSINLMTLLALVMAIGLVVDDAIVVLENIHRRMEEFGESALVASVRGTREVGFAVVATTVVLVAVFVPITFMQGQMGRLFSEFAIAISAAIAFSMLVALTISPMLASRLLKPHRDNPNGKRSFAQRTERFFDGLKAGYGRVFDATVKRPLVIGVFFFATLGASYALFLAIPSEYTPEEDRGQFTVMINGPEGASYNYMAKYIDEVEARLLPMVGNGEIARVVVRAPGFGGGSAFNSGFVMVLLENWNDRKRDGFEILNEINRSLQDLPGVRAFGMMRSGLSGGRGNGKPIQFVIGGPSYEKLVQWRDAYLEALNAENPGISNIDWDFKETQQQFRIVPDYNRAADLGVTVQEIGSTLQTMLGSKRVGTFIQDGEERYVIFEGERDNQATPEDLQNIFVRSRTTQELIPLANLVRVDNMADSRRLNRYNRVRAITIDANLNPGVSMGEALESMERIARKTLPEEAQLDYKGQSLDFKRAGSSIGFVFAFGLLVVFLVLAAQFESWIHPLVIMLCVPATIGGGLFGLWVTGNSINIYSQIGLIMLVGLASKNGILIVEFANQLRDKGVAFADALREAALTRFRPILMTSLTAMAGAVPLIFSHGAGAETRTVIGVTILFGVTAAMFVTLVLVPAAYALLARHTGSPLEITRRLAREEADAKATALSPAE